MKRVFYAFIVAVLGAMGPDTAAQTSDFSEPTPLADSIVVTANRVGISAWKSIWPVAVVTPAKLKNSESLETVLDGEAGLDIRNYNGFGSLSTLSNWGVFARHVLLVYNGRVVKDYSLGGFNLSDFSAEEIQRVEILKGPQSAFYGADAVGGVVNLITNNYMTDDLNLSVKRGSFGYQQYAANISRRLGRFGLAAHAEFASSDNHRHNAGSGRSVFSLTSGYLSPDGRHHLSLSARYFNDSLGVPGPQPNQSYIPVYGDDQSWSLYDHQKDENYSADLQYRYSSENAGNIQLDFFWEKKNLDYNSLYNYQYSYYETPDSSLAVDSVDVFGKSVYNKRSAGLCARYQRQIGRFQLAGGIDYLSGSVRATTEDLRIATNIVGPYAPYEYSYVIYSFWKGAQDQFDVWSNAILRLNDYTQLDLSGRLQFVDGRKTQPAYNVGLILAPHEQLQMKVGYAFAYRLPTIAEQFAEDFFTAGNDDLKAETARSIMATIDFNTGHPGFSSRVTAFHQEVDSLIGYQLDWGTFLYVPRNVDRFETDGADIALAYQWKRTLSLQWNSVIQDAKQTMATREGYVDAFYVPGLKWRFDISGCYDRLTYGFNVSYTSDRSIIIGEDTKVIESVYELGANLGISLTRGLTFSLTGYDLTDEGRSDQFGFTLDDHDYPSPGVRFVAGISYQL
ncbi:MAG: TonB-dependent receptor [Candidatus Zixiibacteriota bacterium]|nr:MAG: TonB-dependent receptor [candidate division Zixibacteria bacterium]